MYKVTFADGSTFEGGNPAESKWDEIPKKPIASLSYTLTPYLTYTFKEFEAYNHTVERVRGINRGLDKITKVVIMGRTKNRVYQVLLDKDGGVYQIVTPAGKEYSPTTKVVNGKFGGWDNPKPIGGWIHGIKDGNPKLEQLVPEGCHVKSESLPRVSEQRVTPRERVTKKRVADE